MYIDLQSRAIYDDKTNPKKIPRILEDGAKQNWWFQTK